MSAAGKKCDCECHEGVHLYHVRWKPCCIAPIDGGEPRKIFGCTMKDDEVRYLIAKESTEVAPFWREEFGLDPIEESVAEVMEGKGA